MRDKVTLSSKRAIGLVNPWLLLLLCFVFCSGAGPVMIQAAEKDYQYDLYLGQMITLPQHEEGTVVSDNEKVVRIQDEFIVAAGAGDAVISVKTADGTKRICKVHVKENEKLKDLTFKEGDFDTMVLGGGAHTIHVPAFDGMECVYKAVTPDIATINGDGTITPKAPGLAMIQVSVKDSYGGVYDFTLPVRIIKPEFAATHYNAAKGTVLTLTIDSLNGLAVTAVSENDKCAKVTAVQGNQIQIQAVKKGTAKITARLGDVAFSCQVYVTEPVLNKKYGFYVKGKKIRLKVTGINKYSKPVWAVSDKKVASVTSKGKVKTKKTGSATVTCTVDGATVTYYLAVASKQKTKVMRYGYSKVGKKKYSQARRMSANYFDCSSFVYRCYRAAGRYLAYKDSWAPVAASIGKYYTQKGKRIKASGKYYNLKKLKPGDLVCWGGSKAKRNGRYKRIYHISLYIGNGLTMESSSTYNNVVIRDRGFFLRSEVPVIVRP